MTTQIETLCEVVNFGGNQIAVDTNLGKSYVDRILEQDDKPKPDDKPQPKGDDKDKEAREAAEKIIDDYTNWQLTIAVSPSGPTERRRKMAELIREMLPKLIPYAALFSSDGDMSKPLTKVSHEAEARRMFAAAGVSGVGDFTLTTVAEALSANNAAKARAIVDDWAKVSGKQRFTAAMASANTYDEALAVLRS